ncbi:hypothetical protein GCM10023107_04670 [Actinoplanes octamycinicus]
MTLFPAEATQREIARELYAHARDLPLISPHGHVDPALLADDEPFPDPARLFVVPDHYVTRMLASQGIPPARLGVPSIDGSEVETDGRAIWRLLAANWHLFRGTPSRLWIEKVFAEVFSIKKAFGTATADEIYDELSDRLAEPEFRPGRCSPGSTSRCWPPPRARSTTSPRTPSSPPTAGAGRAAG